MSGNGGTWTFAYDVNGMRTSRSNGSRTYSYVYNGSSLSQMTVDGHTLLFSYDASSRPVSLKYDGTVYYYALNLQGDVVSILNSSGSTVVTYTYDAWGNILTTTGSMASTLGTHNPLRYRGYVYDTETCLYYLQSRYYNPGTGRFINADALVSTGQGLLGNNMFVYCRNNPVCRIDISGYADTPIEEEYDDDVEVTPAIPEINGGGGAGGSNGPTTVGTTGSNPLRGITYTQKVYAQAEQGDNHSFPWIVDNYGSYGNMTQIIGGDGNVYFCLTIAGEYKKHGGYFEYIWNEEGICNHRYFRGGIV